MIRFFTLLFFIAISAKSFCQIDSLSSRKYRLGVGTSLMQSLHTGMYVNPTIHAHYGKSELYFGPKILTPIEFGATLQTIDKPIQRIGWVLGYQFYPGKQRNKGFNFYFHYLLQYHKFGTSISQELFEDGRFYDRKNEIYLENTVGYGFKYSFTKHFYINQNVGVGIANSWHTYEGRRSVQWLEGNFSLRLGIGYELR